MLVLLAVEVDVHRVLVQTLHVGSLQRCRHGRGTNTGLGLQLGLTLVLRKLGFYDHAGERDLVNGRASRFPIGLRRRKMSEVTEKGRPTSNFSELSRSECEKLLAEHSVGRVGLSAPTGPQILPVTYAYYGKTVVFRTSPYGVLSALERHTRVAFEIDDINAERETGWSVLVLGSADRVTQEYTLSTLWKEGPVPWASGTRNLFIAITPDSITGRSVGARFAD